MSETSLAYRLAESQIAIAGSVTAARDPVSQAATRSAQSTLSIVVAADQGEHAAASLKLGSGVLRSQDMDVHLTADGRLSGLASTVTGAGATAVGAVVRLASVVVSTAAALAGARGDGATVDDAYLGDHPTEAATRAALRTALTGLQTRLATVGSALAADDTPADTRRALQRELGGLARALATVRAEAETAETHFDAWLAVRQARREESHTFTVRPLELPWRAAAQATEAFNSEDIHGVVGEIAEALDVVAVRVGGAHHPTLHPTPDEGALVVRLPRSVRIATYERLPRSADGQQRWQRRSVQEAWVVDEASQLMSIPTGSGIFGERSATLEFSDSGSLTRVASTSEAAVNQIAKAIEDAGGEITSAVDGTKDVLTSVTAIRAQGISDRIAELKRRTEETNAEIVLKGTLAGRGLRERLARLEAERADLEAAQAGGRPSFGAAVAERRVQARIAALEDQLELLQLQLGQAGAGAAPAADAGEGDG